VEWIAPVRLNFGVGFGIGISVILAKSIGGGDRSRAKMITSYTVWLVLVLGLLLAKDGAAPELRASPSQVLMVTFDADSQKQALRAATRLRAEGLQVEWYPSAERLARQLKYADRLGIPLAVILGPDEIREDALTLKDLRSGQQERLPASEAGGRIRQLLMRED